MIWIAYILPFLETPKTKVIAMLMLMAVNNHSSTDKTTAIIHILDPISQRLFKN
jgi:hypothetical protein